jgi:hypothetical protein
LDRVFNEIINLRDGSVELKETTSPSKSLLVTQELKQPNPSPIAKPDSMKLDIWDETIESALQNSLSI